MIEVIGAVVVIFILVLGVAVDVRFDRKVKDAKSRVHQMNIAKMVEKNERYRT